MSQIPQYQNSSGRGSDGGTSGMAIASLVLGICSLVFFCVWQLSIPAAVLAIILGITAHSQFKQGRSGRGLAVAGIVCGIVALCVVLIAFAGLLTLLHLGGPAIQKMQQQIQQQIQQYQQLHNQNLPATNP